MPIFVKKLAYRPNLVYLNTCAISKKKIFYIYFKYVSKKNIKNLKGI